MQIRQETLDKATEAARRAQLAVGHIILHSEGRVEEFARIADDAIVTTIGSLLELGANDADADVSHAFALELPLNALCPPALEPLEETLVAACTYADAVDVARQRAGYDGTGRDLGEQVRQLLARVSLERVGPSERVTGGRE